MPRSHYDHAHLLACILQLLKPKSPNAHALQQEKPLQWDAHATTGEWPSLTATRESPHKSKEDPAKPRNKIKDNLVLSILPSSTFTSSCSVAQSCPTLWDPMDCSTPGFLVLHHLPEFAQTHVHWVSYTIQPPHPLLFPSPTALNLSHYQGLIFIYFFIIYKKFYSLFLYFLLST